MAQEPTNSLDDPDYWRNFVRRALDCPFGASPSYLEFIARQDGVDPHRAVAMWATFYVPGAMPAAVH